MQFEENKKKQGQFQANLINAPVSKPKYFFDIS